MPASAYADWPKVELHFHLEGAIPLPTLWTLVQKYGGDPQVPDQHALVDRFSYQDFPHFLRIWNWMTGYLREAEDFTTIAEAVARDLEAQHHRYVEAFYSPSDFAYHGLTTQEITTAVRRGLDRVRGVEVALIADLVRNRGPEHGLRNLEEIAEVRNCGVIGIGIGGAEHDFPPEPFAPVYARARELGFHTTAHAGEAAGAASIWGALIVLRVERIGHGTRAYEDPRLLRYLAETQTPLEMCPLSNVRTGVVGAVEEHPIRRYVSEGLLVTVNTDDPKLFGNSLMDEYRLLQDRLGFTSEELQALTLNGIRASWLSEPRKDALLAEFQAAFAIAQARPL